MQLFYILTIHYRGHIEEHYKTDEMCEVPMLFASELEAKLYANKHASKRTGYRLFSADGAVVLDWHNESDWFRFEGTQYAFAQVNLTEADEDDDYDQHGHKIEGYTYMISETVIQTEELA